MCGINGFVSLHQIGEEEGKRILHRMNDQIIHRGPDGEGTWINDQHNVGLAHRRLSILELSPLGAQPMSSDNGNFTIVFNGEIYNHLELRSELNSLRSFQWKGHSDTETLLRCIEVWGLEITLNKLIGMFAFSVHDESKRKLYIARDRFGEKPLYYHYSKERGLFLFGSDIKSITRFPDFKKRINIDALALYFRHNYIPFPYSIYEDVFKLEPGSFSELDLCSFNLSNKIYWSAANAIRHAKENSFKGSYNDAVNELETLLKKVVKNQMLSDVSLGAFLSGGVDSSTIVSLMQSQSSIPIKTFSIGFDIGDFDESIYAKKVAQHLGTDHTECIVSEREALDVIPDLSNIFSEPFSDSSQIPTVLVSKLAKKQVTVSLSGDAGDELFGGYNRYTYTQRIHEKLDSIPFFLRNATSGLIRQFDPITLNRLLSFSKYKNIGEKLHKLADVINVSDPMLLYRSLISHFDRPSELVLQSIEPPTLLTGIERGYETLPLSTIERMMMLDTVTYLPDDILAKVDRSAMSVSLETRVPFLDHRVFEFAWSIPMSYKLQGNSGKKILKSLLYRYVPEKYFNRPKMGFGIPLTQWLRGPLRDWTYETLSLKKIKDQGLLNERIVSQLLDNHMSKKEDNGYKLWDILMLQSWLEKENGG